MKPHYLLSETLRAHNSKMKYRKPGMFTNAYEKEKNLTGTNLEVEIHFRRVKYSAHQPDSQKPTEFLSIMIRP